MKEKITKDKIKEFWNEHKYAIITGTIAGIGGVTLGLFIKSDKVGQRLSEMFKDYDMEFINDLDIAQSGSTGAHVYMGTPGKATIANGLEAVKNACANRGISLDTEATGMVIFMKE